MKKKYNGIVIAGPTAVGKTNMSIVIGKRINGEIISADASQVYKNLDIGTAKITEEEMDGVKHHLIDIVECGEDYSVGNFERDVNEILERLERAEKDVLLVGGTGLYIRAITDGFSNLPSKNVEIRGQLDKKTLEELQGQLKELDLESYEKIDINNRVRLIRAIEVCLLTGGKFSQLRAENVKNNNYNFLKIFLTRDREELYERINKRVDIMIEGGLIDEAKMIFDNYKDKLYKINAIGYKELFEYFRGEVTLEEAISNIKQESRRYAKRQLTWFKKCEDYKVYNLSEMSEDEVVENIMKEYFLHSSHL